MEFNGKDNRSYTIHEIAEKIDQQRSLENKKAGVVKWKRVNRKALAVRINQVCKTTQDIHYLMKRAEESGNFSKYIFGMTKTKVV